MAFHYFSAFVYLKKLPLAYGYIPNSFEAKNEFREKLSDPPPALFCYAITRQCTICCIFMQSLPHTPVEEHPHLGLECESRLRARSITERLSEGHKAGAVKE